MSATAPGLVAPAPSRTASSGTWANWLVRRRVAISLIGFALFALSDLFWWKLRPRDLANWNDWGTALAEILIVGGLLIRSWAAGILRKSQILTVQGPYALVRNPLYVGSFGMMFGFCIVMRDMPALAFAIGPVAILYWFQVRHEEANLGWLFANQWPAYAARTPRFVPRRFSRESLRGWTCRQWLCNREYRALLASLAALAGIYAISHRPW